MLLEDRVAIITGAAKGMGKSMAVKFAEEGCAVAIVDIDTTEMDRTLGEIIAAGGKALGITCDITDIEQVQDAVGRTLDTYGRIDILVNNAGGHASAPPIEEMTEEEWDETMDLNLKSVFLFCKFIVPFMKVQRYGKIINLSSIGALQPPAHVIHYNTAKMAIVGFTSDLGRELAKYNINVNAIMPGPVRTHFYDKTTADMEEEQKEKFFTFMGKKTPLQRVGEPEDLANVALFLASEMSAYVTCQVINAAGGLPQTPQQ